MGRVQRKSVGSYSLRLVDFAIRLVNSVHDLPNEQVKVLRGIQITQGLYSILHIKEIFRLLKMTLGLLVTASYSLPER